jgi:hypothetical protein
MPEQQRPARRHHVVSKFYLQQFANAQGQLLRLPLDGKPHLQSVTDATVQKHFNTLNVEGLEPDHFEKGLAMLESVAAKAFKACVRDRQWPLPLDHRLALAGWIAVQYLRGEDKRAMAADVHQVWKETVVVPASTDELRDLLGVPLWEPDSKVESIRAWVLAANAEADRHVHLSSIRSIMIRAVPAVFWRKWSLIVFSWDALGTADTPVVRIPGPNATGPVGLGDAAGLYVPLTSRAGLYLGGPGTAGPDECEDGSPLLAARWNQLVRQGAYKTLFHLPGTDPFADATGRLPA